MKRDDVTLRIVEISSLIVASQLLCVEISLHSKIRIPNSKIKVSLSSL